MLCDTFFDGAVVCLNRLKEGPQSKPSRFARVRLGKEEQGSDARNARKSVLSQSGLCDDVVAEEHRKRTRKLNVYLLDEELAILDAKADEAEMSKSEYIRNMIMFGAAHERTMFSKADSEALIYELNRIGNNINQIAYWANVNKTIDRRDFRNMYDNYMDLLSAYDRFIRGKSHGDY